MRTYLSGFPEAIPRLGARSLPPGRKAVRPCQKGPPCSAVCPPDFGDGHPPLGPVLAMVTGQIEEAVSLRALHPAREVKANSRRLRETLPRSGGSQGGARLQPPGPRLDQDIFQLGGPRRGDLPAPGRKCVSPRDRVHRASGDLGEGLGPVDRARGGEGRSHPPRLVEYPREDGRSESPFLGRCGRRPGRKTGHESRDVQGAGECGSEGEDRKAGDGVCAAPASLGHSAE
jgi:hypothetical protein